ncbi:hypothetical protein F5Y12DRAFT_469949 [Xylaria sp. FL1777]|nr:hypothetical protein F5Y12DRAFT_469949 [Xylaria sp. FL1777]
MMAVHEVVLDPDGDILVIVPGKLPEGHVEATDSGPDGINIDETEPPAEPVIESEEPEPSASVPQEEEQWRFKASSKHLALASTYAKKMMAGPWREANETHDDGLLHWNFDGFDVNAISIILSVIHGLNRRVPRIVSLAMLAEIARVVDYLECHEVMELYASIWVDHIRDPVPSPSREDWDGWISVAGVFQNTKIFKKWTRIAIMQKLNSPPSLELPILSRVYDVMDQQRQLHLDKIVSCIYGHVNRLSEQKTCSVECDAILLGTLIRQLRANSLPSICPAQPYEGLSFDSVVKAIRGLAVPEWYSKVDIAEESVQNAFEFWGAPKKMSRLQQKRAKTKAKRTSQTTDPWGQVIMEEVEGVEELAVAEHSCGFNELLATVTSLESEIQGLDLENDLGVKRAE